MNNEFFLDFSAALPEDAAEDQVINNYSLCLTCKPLITIIQDSIELGR